MYNVARKAVQTPSYHTVLTSRDLWVMPPADVLAKEFLINGLPSIEAALHEQLLEPAGLDKMQVHCWNSISAFHS